MKHDETNEEASKKWANRLSAFLKLAVAASDFATAANEAFGKPPKKPERIYRLHKIALMELDKPNPSKDRIGRLLHEMERTVQQNVFRGGLNFEKGGVVVKE